MERLAARRVREPVREGRVQLGQRPEPAPPADPAREADAFEIGGGPVGSDCLRHGDEALTGDAEPEAAQRSAPAAAAEASPAAEDAGRVGETSTRRILQALTHVLVEKGMLTRAELIHQIQELAKTDDA